MYEEFAERIRSEAAKDDPAPLYEACVQLTEALGRSDVPMPDETARALLRDLRRHRRFSAMRILSVAFLEDGINDAEVTRHLAQSLIELGEGSTAIHLLEGVLKGPELPHDEWAEVKAAIGRAWKDRAVRLRTRRPNAARPATLAAVRSYRDVWEKDPSAAYQGVNYIALTLWAGLEFFSAEDLAAAKLAAQSIVEKLSARPEVDMQPWDIATLGEAFLGLGRIDEAAKHYGRYAANENSSFALAGSVRQLVTLWRVSDKDGGSDLLAPLVGKLGILPGGSFNISGNVLEALAAVPESRHEAIFGGAKGARSYRWLQEGFETAKAVVMIRRDGYPIGTGFVVTGSDLGLDVEGPVVVTNHHVVSDPPRDGAARPEDATILFEILSRPDKPLTYCVKRLLWQSSSLEHDITIIELDGALPEGFTPLKLASSLPLLHPAAGRVYVIGHPMGREVSFSFEDNLVLDYERPPTWVAGSGRPCRIHYRAPTEKGSSGSPIFNASWMVVGVHHAGDRAMPKLNGKRETYEANEGMWIGAVREALAKRADG